MCKEFSNPTEAYVACRFADGFLEFRDPDFTDKLVQIDQTKLNQGGWIDSFEGKPELIQRTHKALGKYYREKQFQMFEYHRGIIRAVSSGLTLAGREVGVELVPIDNE